MAAGIGKRARPLTYSVPKPLIRVNGMPIIESSIRALSRNGIKEIYIVVGYLKELFVGYAGAWMEKYGVSVELIENPYYASCNNISSFFVAREHFENCFIVEGDLLIRNEALFSSDFQKSGYCAYYVTDGSIDWQADVDDHDRIIRCVYPGDRTEGWQLIGISRWTAGDGRHMKESVEHAFLSGETDAYGDDIALIKEKQAFDIAICRISADDITEIDDMKTLQELDPAYTCHS